MHGTRGSNSRHLVLETSALPTELVPYFECKGKHIFDISKQNRNKFYPAGFKNLVDAKKKRVFLQNICRIKNYAYLCTVFQEKRFPKRRNMVNVAQLVRALDCGSKGRGFEPHLSPIHSEQGRTLWVGCPFFMG